MKIRVLLVEDEANIRMILRKMIERNPSFEVVGESDNMTDALLLFHKFQPQVVFMDIEIQGSSGIECAKVMADVAPKTKIIFATAHAEYMSNAFELYAFDYLVKPFDMERVAHTLERIEAMEPVNDTETVSVQSDLQAERLIVKGKESISFVDIKDIILIQRENNRTVIYTAEEAYITSAGLGDIEAKLDHSRFMRSHKSYIINITAIKKIEPYGRWTYTVTLKGIEQDALMTKENYDALKTQFI